MLISHRHGWQEGRVVLSTQTDEAVTKNTVVKQIALEVEKVFVSITSDAAVYGDVCGA